MDNTTAKVSCFARAYHYENNKEFVFADSMAKNLLGEEYEQIAESMTEQYFATYNNTSGHPMAVPAGVGYVLAEILL